MAFSQKSGVQMSDSANRRRLFDVNSPKETRLTAGDYWRRWGVIGLCAITIWFGLTAMWHLPWITSALTFGVVCSTLGYLLDVARRMRG
jgi:hypothetical protein